MTKDSSLLAVTLLRVHTGIQIDTSDGRTYYAGGGYTSERDIRRAYPGQWGDLENPGDTAHIIDYAGLFRRRTDKRKRSKDVCRK